MVAQKHQELHMALTSAMTKMLAIPSAIIKHDSVQHPRTYHNKYPNAIFGLTVLLRATFSSDLMKPFDDVLKACL